MKGSITRLQRMSIHDGPGIRSTLFLKGCNFRCKWCHNPETWSPKQQIERVAERCIACGLCVEACPSRALYRKNDGIGLDRCACERCGKCADLCPTRAMNRVGMELESREVLEKLRRDMPYFRESGGGLTLSGGEPLLQPDFIGELLTLCRAEGIATAVETNLGVGSEVVERLLGVVDLWMCDLKTADDALHRQWTGVPNARTIANLRLLAERNAPVIVRTPVIPGVNDNPQAIRAICTVLEGMQNLRYYELLGFHTLGGDKFAMLGMDNPMSGVESLSEERLEVLRRVVVETGINTK